MKFRKIDLLIIGFTVFCGLLCAEEITVSDNITAEATKKGIQITAIPNRQEVSIFRFTGDKLQEEEGLLLYKTSAGPKKISFVDEYVVEGEKYTYKIKNHGDYGEEGYSNTVTAIAGKGDIDFNVTPCEGGFHITSGVKIQKKYCEIKRYKAEDVNRNNYCRFSTRRDDKKLDFVDKFVNGKQEYIYEFLYYNVGDRSGNGFVRYSKEIKVKTDEAGEFGEYIIVNKPTATFDASTSKVTFTTLPQIEPSSDDYDWTIYFSCDNGNYGVGQLKKGEDSFVIRKVLNRFNIDTGYSLWVWPKGSNETTFTYYDSDCFSEMPEIVFK